MSKEKPIDRAIAALEAQFKMTGLPRLHPSQYEAMALSVLRCWSFPTDAMLEAAESVQEQVLTATYPDSDGHFVDGGLETLWLHMITAANNEVVDQRGS